VRALIALLAHPATLRRAALSSLVANVALVVTGGAVRLTDSGLGCPTWPRCTDTSYVTTSAMGVHGVIEYGNRMLVFVLTVIVAFGVLCALLLPRSDAGPDQVRTRGMAGRRRVIVLAVANLATIPAQAVLGGITVLSHLNPWVVACHFLLSIAIIAVAHEFWTATREVTGSRPRPDALAHSPAGEATLVRTLVGLVWFATGAVIVVGTVVTGSGPHAGNATARRTGLDPGAVAQLHADLVFLLAGLAIATALVLRVVAARTPAARPAATRAWWLLGIVLGQGVVGFVQYATHLPALIVGVHMAGACAVWVAALSLTYTVRSRPAPAVATATMAVANRSAAPAQV
jgi:cytochrome c oxidase assembly protein subunit 15